MHQAVTVILSLIFTTVRGQKPGSIQAAPACRKEVRTYSYAYNDFYRIDEAGGLDGPGNVSLQVYVQAVSDAHVLLSTVPFPKPAEPVYEIVLGGGRNTFSEVRRSRRTSTAAAVATSDLLSAAELRGFWVRLRPSGMLEVGERGSDLPFLFWKDPHPLRIRYFSFSTWTGVAGKFLFDCPAPGDPDGAETSEPVPTKQTTLERLRSDLLTNYDPYSRPVLHEDHYTTVYVRFASRHIQLDEKRGLLSTHGRMSMNWIDEKIVWDPENYDNISVLNLASHEVWLPEIVLYNAAGHGADVLGEAGLAVGADGRARWAPQARLRSWCRLDLRRWPRDEHSCDLRLGFWAQQQPRLLLQLDNTTEVSEQRTGSQWEVVDLNSHIVWGTEIWADGQSEYETELNQEPTPNLIIQIRLRRREESYTVILTAPFIVINAITFLSFWMSPNNFAKTIFVCLALVISSMVAAILTDVIPTHPSHTPFIVLVYSRSMIAALVSLLLTVTTICLSRYNHVRPLPGILYKHITSEYVCTILFLPRTTSEINTKYSQLDETRQNNQAARITRDDIQLQWRLLAVYLDRICSILFCVFIGIVFATC
ncbi:acetylcholine receptor subunit alpha-like [Bacillus rossius redtenbacheri]|uniref:acetylcholine receptor subunit alpha-like n=1 Tax=Bacillus rossius redtenbacheri TaxID=93214 RepID=UPI002FDCB798